MVKNKSGLLKNIQKICKEYKLDIVIQESTTWTFHSIWIIWIISHTTNLIAKFIIKIQKDSNLSPIVLKKFSTSIEKIIFTWSSNETIFNKSKEIYQKSLEKFGCRQTLNYHSANKNVKNNKQNRKQNVIWFNPPFRVNVKTKVRNSFLNLIRKHCSPNYKFIKLFNRNTMNVSYNCIPNIKAKIHKREKNTLEKLNKNIQVLSSETEQ